MTEEKDSSVSTIGLIILGAAVFYLILKSNSQTKQMQQQVQQLQQAQQKMASDGISSIYENDEKWQIERGDDGHIIDLRVVRNARVSDGTLELPSLRVPDAERVVRPVESLQDRIQQGRIQQDRIAEMTKLTRMNGLYRMNEADRKQRFGMV